MNVALGNSGGCPERSQSETEIRNGEQRRNASKSQIILIKDHFLKEKFEQEIIRPDDNIDNGNITNWLDWQWE